MSSRLSTVAVVLVLSWLLTSGALAGPKEDVQAATTKWAETLGQNDPDKIVLLYATDGVLWGTLSPTLRSNREGCVTILSARSRSCRASRSTSVNN
jgi:hypothetical protein